MSNIDPIINWRGVNSRNTDNIGEQVKKKVKNMSSTNLIKN